MPRRREIPKREAPLDPSYSSALVTKFISTLMRDGKRSTAEESCTGSLSTIQEKNGRRSFEGLQKGCRKRQAGARGQITSCRRARTTRCR